MLELGDIKKGNNIWVRTAHHRIDFSLASFR
jgi:hypothetical protein